MGLVQGLAALLGDFVNEIGHKRTFPAERKASYSRLFSSEECSLYALKHLGLFKRCASTIAEVDQRI